MHLGRRWDENYAAAPNLVFPVGIVDRPFKHDQHPLLVETFGDGANQLVVGVSRSGKTTALQTLICAAAMTHTPEQVQFYCLALSSAALGTIAGLPHVGGVAYAHGRGRRAPHHLGDARATRTSPAQLPRVRDHLDARLPRAQVRRRTRGGSR